MYISYNLILYKMKSCLRKLNFAIAQRFTLHYTTQNFKIQKPRNSSFFCAVKTDINKDFFLVNKEIALYIHKE